MSALPQSAIAELQRLKDYFPFRIVFAAVRPTGEIECYAKHDRRTLNKLIRSGCKVWEAR